MSVNEIVWFLYVLARNLSVGESFGATCCSYVSVALSDFSIDLALTSPTINIQKGPEELKGVHLETELRPS